MNDMPVPEGDYFTLHAQRQRKYNTRLAAGVTMSGLGLVVVSDLNACMFIFSHLRSLSLSLQLTSDKVVHFHWSPPDTYE
jgi:hypothetical protein